MARSFREIDYRLRPAKYAERHMIVDALRRLRFDDLTRYLYVGLGAIYFADFLLFHRLLGVSDMINIEEAVGSKPRFLANAPLNIDQRFGKTGTELAGVPLETRRAIVWLDYDGRLVREVMLDIANVAQRATSGTVFAVSVQCKPEVPHGFAGRVQIDQLAAELGPENINPSLTDISLLGEGTVAVFYSAMSSHIANAVSSRNAVLPLAQQIRLQQLMFFRYEDGAEMMTVCWLFYNDAEIGLYQLAAFDTLDFYSAGATPVKIVVPKITSTEARLLQTQMPLRPGKLLNPGQVPPADADRYKKFYRYLPSFISAEWH